SLSEPEPNSSQHSDQAKTTGQEQKHHRPGNTVPSPGVGLEKRHHAGNGTHNQSSNNARKGAEQGGTDDDQCGKEPPPEFRIVHRLASSMAYGRTWTLLSSPTITSVPFIGAISG